MPVLLVDDNVEFVGLLGTLFAEQGLVPSLAHTGEVALDQLEHHSFAAIVLDLLLPDITGHRLLKKMVDRFPSLPPIFIVTGVFKGEAQRAKVDAVHAVEGWYEKPFDTRLLVERVMTTVGREVVERQRHQAIGQVVGDFEIDIIDPVDMSVDIEIDVADSADLAPADPTAPVAYWDSATVAPKAVESPADTIPGLAPVSREAIERDAALATTDDIEVQRTASGDLGDLDDDGPSIQGEPRVVPPARKDPFGDTSSGFGATTTPSPAQVAEDLRTSLRSGDLSTTTMPRLINAFYIAQETGEIAFERGRQRKIVYFERGRPVYAVSNQETDRLAVFVRRIAGVTHKQLTDGLAEAKSSKRLLADVLIAKGIVSANRRDDLLREQTRGLVRSLFTWSDGRYVVGFNASPDSVRIELPEHPGALVLTGIRDLFELSRLQQLLADELRLIPAPNPPFGFEDLPLTDAEALLILQVTGRRTVAELVRAAPQGLDERGVRAVLYALLCLGIHGIIAS